MKLYDWRKREGFTLEQVADKIGCSSATVSRLENGKQSPSLALANRLRLASSGEVTPNDFPSVPSEPEVA